MGACKDYREDKGVKKKNQKKDLEIVLAMGIVRVLHDEFSIGGINLNFVNRKIKELDGENILLKVVVARENWHEEI